MRNTKDILFVAWLDVVKSIKFVGFKILDDKKKIAEFEFDIPSDDWNNFKQEFYTSETTKTRYAVQRIKDLLN